MNYQTSTLMIASFKEMALAPQVYSALERMQIAKPTAIQSQAIPVSLTGAEAIVIAQTGSGKTLAYALPIVTTLNLDMDARALILAPTREVAEQIYRVFLQLYAGSSIVPVLIVGGTPNKEQVSCLRKKPKVVIATPGRMNDHLMTNKLLLQNTKIVVIDEADRMLDMGFAPQLDSIRKTMRGKWQTLMYSASFGPSVEKVAEKFMNSEPFLVRADRAETPVQMLTQKVFLVDRGMKNDELARQLKTIKGKVMVFAGNQISCEEIGQHLKQNGYSSDMMHGGLEMGHRTRVLRDFREGKFKILTTTDLLARGLDVPGIECVINYDLPTESEDFLHRIGRTARAGKKGNAITFVTPGDRVMHEKIKRYLLKAEEVKLN